MNILLKDCRLIPELSDGYGELYGDVVLSEGEIEGVYGVGQEHTVDQSIDCQGKTLLPGLFDCRARFGEEAEMTDFAFLTHNCLSTRKYLDHGITTIQDMGSPRRVSTAVRHAVKEGLFRGPRIVSGGMKITVQPEFLAEGAARVITGREEMIRAVREEIGGGANFILLELAGEGPGMLEEELEAALRIARLKKMRVAAHVCSSEALYLCMEALVDVFILDAPLESAAIQWVKERGCCLAPTLTRLHQGGPECREMPERMAVYARGISNAYRAGVKLGFGTDLTADELDTSLALELKLRNEVCGVRNIDLLLQATKYSAWFCGLQNITGEIKKGLAADLILVDGKPDQDLSVLYRRPEIVFVQGREYRPSCV